MSSERELEQRRGVTDPAAKIATLETLLAAVVRERNAARELAAASQARVAAYQAEPLVGYGVTYGPVENGEIYNCFLTGPAAGSVIDETAALLAAHRLSGGPRRVVSLHAREISQERRS